MKWFRRPRESGPPGATDETLEPWVPAFAGTTRWTYKTIDDGLGHAARMGGEEPARHLQGPDHRRGCPQFADDRLPVPLIAVLPRDRRRRPDPGSGRTSLRLPAKL